MAEIKRITENELRSILAEHPFSLNMLTKDCYITLLLYLMKDIKGLHFKGGTALQKTILHHSRISEDIDFSLTEELKRVKKEIISSIKKADMFKDITEDKRVEKFTRLIVHYKGFGGEDGSVFIDINERDILLQKPKKHKIHHFYEGFIPKFEVSIVSPEELVAGKVRAAITRNKPRDHYDLYRIVKEHIPINIKLVKQKCKQADEEFGIIRMFNKAKKLKNQWDKDLVPLLTEEVSFHEVIKTLAKHFRLKEEKERAKPKK